MIKFKEINLPLLKDRNFSSTDILLGVRLQLEATEKLNRDELKLYSDKNVLLDKCHSDLKHALWASLYGDIHKQLLEIHDHLIKMEAVTGFSLEVGKLIAALIQELNETKP